METNSKNPPVIVIRDGALKVSIWENQSESGSFLSATFAKTYTKDEKPRDGHSFSRGDLLPLSELIRTVYRRMGKKQTGIDDQFAEAAPGQARQ